MKKAIFIIGLITIAFSVTAQNISIGSTLGLGDKWINDFKEDTKFSTSWNAGVSLIYSVKRHFDLGIDVKYSREGNKSSYLTPGPADGLITVTNTINSNYIRVPLKLIYFFGNDKAFIRPKIYAGTDFGFFLNGKNVADYAGYKVKNNSKDLIKSFDFGGIIAAGINFKLLTGVSLNTDVVYYNGFTNIAKHNYSNLNMVMQTNPFPTNDNYYNCNLQLGIGLLIGLKK